MAALVVFAAGTIAGRITPAKSQQPMLEREAFDPALSNIRSVDQAMAALPRFIGVANPSRAQVADGIDRFLRARFYHRYSQFSPSQDWLAYLAGDIWSDLRSPVLPDDILQYRMAACSQQAMVFQAMLKRSGIDYASVGFNNPGHFTVAARTERGWLFYDSDQEPRTATGLPLAGILKGDALPALYPRHGLGRAMQAAARRGDASWGGIDRYPAPRAALLHRVTHFLSAFGWLLLLALLAGLRALRRVAGRATAVGGQGKFASENFDAMEDQDRRRAPRVATIMRVGALRTATGRTLCIVRNISSGGALIDGDLDHVEGEKLAVELKNGAEIDGTVAWARDGSLGVTFDRLIDLGKALADRHGRNRGGRARMPRIELRRPVRVEAGADGFDATLLDISQHGAKLALDRPIDGRIRIEIPGLGLRKATIRWRADDRAGLSFDRAVPFGELAAWLTRRNDPAEVSQQQAKIA